MSEGLHPDARTVVDAYFLDSAEEDYLVARWAAQHGRHHQFSWSASQTVEKVLKAIALKGRLPLPGKGNGHDSTGMFDMLVDKQRLPAAALILQTSLPKAVLNASRYSHRLRPTRTREIVDRFAQSGSPSVRYRNTADSLVFLADVHMLDAVFKLLREIAGRPHREPHSSEQIEPGNDLMTSLFVARFPSLRGVGDQTRLRLARLLTFQNIEFFPELFSEDIALIGGFSRALNPWPIRQSNAVDFEDHQAKADLEWLLENARIRRSDQTALKSLAKEFATRSRKQ